LTLKIWDPRFPGIFFPQLISKKAGIEWFLLIKFSEKSKLKFWRSLPIQEIIFPHWKPETPAMNFYFLFWKLWVNSFLSLHPQNFSKALIKKVPNPKEKKRTRVSDPIDLSPECPAEVSVGPVLVQAYWPCISIFLFLKKISKNFFFFIFPLPA